MHQSVKTNSLAFALWTLCSCALHILLFKAKVDASLPVLHRIPVALAAIVFILPVHEAIHALFMKLFYQGKVKLIFAKGALGLPMPGVSTTGKAAKWQHGIMLIAPFVLLTVLPDVLFAFSKSIHPFFFFVAIGNCAGCFYDMTDLISIAGK